MLVPRVLGLTADARRHIKARHPNWPSLCVSSGTQTRPLFPFLGLLGSSGTFYPVLNSGFPYKVTNKKEGCRKNERNPESLSPKILDPRNPKP